MAFAQHPGQGQEVVRVEDTWATSRCRAYPILEELGIEQLGFHSFRRFRVTHLESSYVPSALVKYRTGHAKSSDGEIG